MAAADTLNFNIGVLGHIDSGKTALARALSTTASTAAFDKNPQSRERGITLDLGFSSFCLAAPPHLGQPQYSKLQVTLVDCPGHASLIRTIIGGSQIIDLMMLVIDVTKGMQTQSAECLVIGEITCPRMVVVLNKIDLLPEAKKQVLIDKMTKKMQKTLENTRFKGCPIIPVAAKPGGPDAAETETPQGISELIELLISQTYMPKRDPSGSFLMAADHCFSIKGQGTVMTGTILSGSVSVNDSVEIPALKIIRKVKSIQMFRKPVNIAIQGDRVGICVTQFDPKQLERGLICSPESLCTLYAAVVSVKKIPYFKGPVHTKAKFHITVGHETVMSRVMFFSRAPEDFDAEPVMDCFDFDKEYLYQEEYLSPGKDDGIDGQTEGAQAPRQQWALLEFEKPVVCPKLCLVIGSKLDIDIHTNTCRLAFHGVLLEGFEEKNYAEVSLPKLKVFKSKYKEGQVERVSDDYSVIGRSLFKKETNIQLFVGMKVKLSTGEVGVIDGGFGQSGKFKIRVPDGLSPEAKLHLALTSKKKAKGARGDSAKAEEEKSDAQPITITLAFKRYLFDPQKKMIQS
ncbi:selenocysteine-specific elongation factor [Hemitrygon akajei]|uniref:selenocysteine-specific elongation factor n=1 Tax=Hemitrygon akajei TaxID=2704970 RepID=UPI003BFA346B